MAALLLSAAPGWAAQDPSALGAHERRRQDLMRRAQEALAGGDAATAGRLTAEAWAVQADIDWDSMRPECADAAFNEARRLGWMGEPPWVLRPRRLQDPPPAAGERPVLRQEERPVLAPPERRVPREAVNTWPYVATAPFHHGRNTPWHSLLNTPSFEEALVPPEGVWHFRTWVELATAGFQVDEGGLVSQWIADFHQENFELNYSYTDRIMIGARFAMGELLEFQDAKIRVFEDGQQVVPAGTRGFDADNLILRAKYAGDAEFANLGAIVELKFPLGFAENMMSTSTIDIAVSGLLTKRWDEWILHANLGFVIPFGDPEMFVAGFDEVNPYLHGALGASYIYEKWLVLGLQLEANTSAYTHLDLLTDPTFTITAMGRFRLSETVFLALGTGTGFNDFSGDWMGSAQLDVTF